MAGIKRKQSGTGKSDAAAKSKKLKPSPNSKSSKPSSKHADKSASKSKSKPSKSDAPKSKPRREPEPDIVESDTTEDEADGFDGFSEGGADSSDEAPQSKKPRAQASGSAGATTTTANGGMCSKSQESHAKQKVLVKERKAQKPNADVIARAKQLWERLRRKSHVPKEERQQLVAELFEIVTGRVKDFVFKHDSVRTVQCALKYATMPQRLAITEELKGEFRSLAESRYAKFLIGKMLVEGDDKIRDIIVPEFYGHIRRLINHPEASWILDDIYRQKASKEQKAMMLREWYGPEFAVFKVADKSKLTANLSEILKENPEKRKPIMDYLHGMINQLIQKKLTGFTMLHDAMLQYFENLTEGSAELGDYLKLIIGDTKEEEIDLLKNLAFTKSGARIVCLTLAHSPSKDRRAILKAFKDVIELMAYDQYGHTILLTAFDVVDDTREISSRILSELIKLSKSADADAIAASVLALADHIVGRIPLLYPFAGAAKWLIRPDTAPLIEEVHALRAQTSKKNPETRRAELIAALSPPLLATIAAHARALCATQFGPYLVTEVLLHGTGDKNAALAAVADLAEGDPSAEEHVAQSAAVRRMLKTLVGGGPFDPVQKKVIPVDPPLGFHNLLLERVQPWVGKWAVGEGAFVVVGLLEAEGLEGREGLISALREVKGELEGVAGEVGEKNGAKKAKKGKGKKEVVEKGEGKKGNPGARIILGLLDA
ncbi:ARM repeat-containing protein [Trichodelitschia bisporula]|uniref:ARM repeat-containing protein n=1 Tax=Trichodelitschia bisporula TaxID=703511 RepID=A0A6G1HZK3_9PEZI|nr:ARM repeat-containing protein [Trichodelitschia bisporula]